MPCGTPGLDPLAFPSQVLISFSLIGSLVEVKRADYGRGQGGHKDIRMTMRYSHLALNHMKNAVKVLDRVHQDVSDHILDGHYLDTEGSEQKIRMLGLQSNILTSWEFSGGDEGI